LASEIAKTADSLTILAFLADSPASRDFTKSNAKTQ